jgi:hypothetical protein
MALAASIAGDKLPAAPLRGRIDAAGDAAGARAAARTAASRAPAAAPGFVYPNPNNPEW